MAEEEKNQEELAKEWEEALKQQEGEKSQEEIAKEWEEALKQQEESSEKGQEDLAKEWEEALKSQETSETEASERESSCDKEFELLKDIPLEISVEIGSTKLTLEEILRLHANSVVELDRFVDEPVDIKINGKLVAKGKLYQVEDNYGVEIVQIITPEERLKLIEE